MLLSGAKVGHGRDNDCDEQIDEGFDTQTDPQLRWLWKTLCGAQRRRWMHGRCVHRGVLSVRLYRSRWDLNGCEWACGNVDGSVGPEGCDNRDNDCNGMIDDGVTRTCTTQARGRDGDLFLGRVRRVCIGRTPAAETCNGIDDDCDGFDHNLGTTVRWRRTLQGYGPELCWRRSADLHAQHAGCRSLQWPRR